MSDLYHGKTTGLGVTFNPSLDYDINPHETLGEVNSDIWDNVITHKMKELDSIWISGCVSFYSSLPLLIN